MAKQKLTEEEKAARKEARDKAKAEKQKKIDDAKAKADANKQAKQDKKKAAKEARDKSKKQAENKVKRFSGINNGLKMGNRYMRWGCKKDCNAKFLIMDKPLSLHEVLKMDDAVVNKIMHCNPLLRKSGRSCKHDPSIPAGSGAGASSSVGPSETGKK